MIKSCYIHIPFCDTICTYCDFCKFYYNKDWCKKYFKSLKKEILKFYKNEELETLYIGGGTPSCLSLEELEELFSILDIFSLKKDYEFTFECNIENLTKEKLEFLFNHKVNRLSIGVQTFDPELLLKLNRHHSKKEVFEKISLAKQIGFKNINIDLIYGLPSQTLKQVDYDLDCFLKLDIPHISLYSLIIEPHTKFYIDGVEENGDFDFDCYQNLMKKLKSNYYEHYEISNFCKKGYASRHNLTYWKNEEYYGFGIGASGYIKNIRYTNTRSFNEYLKENFRLEEETMNKDLEIQNSLMLGLRLINGIDLKEFECRFHHSLDEYSIIKKLLQEKKLERYKGHIRIPLKLIYIQNSILVELVGESYE